MLKQSIEIRDQRCAIEVHRMGKTVWLAVGEYVGQRVRATGTTAQKAAKAWRKVAEFRANVSEPVHGT